MYTVTIEVHIRVIFDLFRPSSVAWEVRKSPSKSRQTTSLVYFKEQPDAPKKYSENAISLDQVSDEVPLGQSQNSDVEIVPESISVGKGKGTHSFGEEGEHANFDVFYRYTLSVYVIY